MARAAGKVIGVELEPQAVADARDNARRNGITNAEFFCGDAGQAALELQSRGLTADVVVVDPPRKGLSPDVIQALAQMSPRKIAYVSCDPATLARDVALLKEQGFRLQKAKAVDMFPKVCTCGDGGFAFQGRNRLEEGTGGVLLRRYGYVRVPERRDL